MRVHAYGALDYAVLGRLQSIEVAWPRADVDALSTLRALGDVVLHLEALSPCDVLGESLLTRGRRLSRLGAGDFLHRGDDGRFDGLSARLYGITLSIINLLENIECIHRIAYHILLDCVADTT